VSASPSYAAASSTTEGLAPGDRAVVAAAVVETHLGEQFVDLDTQRHAATFGMWVFLASEALFFGALFALYAGYRTAYPHAFRVAAQHTDLLLGSTMTYVLLTASFLVALAVGAVRVGAPRRAATLLVAAAALAALFLVLKAVEWSDHLQADIFPGHYEANVALTAPGARAFFTLYYLMTGLHFLHTLAGFFVLAWLAVRARRGAYGPLWHTPLELGGMYWHFVDVVWLFLWPLFYLLR